jgi:hypothetical protein
MRFGRLRSSVSICAVAAAALLGPLSPARADSPLPPDISPGTGYDVSHPQCGVSLPTGAAFVVIGVNAGRVFTTNPCLDEQTTWAYDSVTTPSYYANTANPGPLLSDHWPSGQTFPRACDATYPENDSAGCSYDYGWTAAQDSYNDAWYSTLATYGEAAAKPNGDWWLDVETSNSWQTLQAGPTSPEQAQLNASAALEGAVAYLSTVAGVRQVGFYSSPAQWDQITGGTGDRFAAYPVWLAGAGDRASALAHCDPSQSFTSGAVAMAQYREGEFDANVRCDR